MFTIAVSQAEGIDARRVARQAAERARRELDGLAPRAGVVIASAEFDHQAVLAELTQAFPGVEFVGATSAGEFTSGLGPSDDSVSLCLFASDTIDIRSGAGLGLSRDPDAAVQTALDQALSRLDGPPRLCLAFPDGMLSAMDKVLEALTRRLGTTCPAFGGGAARPWDSALPTRQFHNDQVLQDALTVLCFSGPLDFSFCVSHCWEPVSAQSRVTESREGRILRIGDMTALEFYRHYLGRHTSPALEHPLAVYVSEKDFYIRTPAAYDESEGSITFSTSIPIGAQVALAESTAESIIESTARTIESLRYPDRGWPAGALVFSCLARKYELGARARREYEIIKEFLPWPVPIFGFHAMGEIAPPEAGQPGRFHNKTMVTLLLGEVGCRQERDILASAPGCLCEYDDSSEALAERAAFLRKKLDRALGGLGRMERAKTLNSQLFKTLNQELNAANRKIKGSERTFRRIVETAPAGFVLLKDRLAFAYANETFCAMVGRTADSLEGMTLFDLATPDSREFLAGNLDDLLIVEPRAFELDIETAQGRVLPTMFHGAELKDDEGRPIGRMAFVTDLSEMKKAEALKEDMDRIARHDLKTPLNAILALPEMLLMDDNLQESQREALRLVRESGYRMLNIVNLSLNLYKMETGTYAFMPKPVDLLRLIRTICIENRQIALSKGVETRVFLRNAPVRDTDAFVVQGEETLCYSMLANLHKNAIEASPRGEAVSIDLHDGPPGWAEAIIHNKGAVPDSLHGRFFEKYATANKTSGTGLGAYSALLMARTQGGDIELNASLAEDATTLTIRLPRVGEMLPEPTKPLAT